MNFHVSLNEQLDLIEAYLGVFSVDSRLELKKYRKHRQTNPSREQFAKPIATAIRVLLHDTDRSTSLTSLFGVKSNLTMITTAADRNAIHSISLLNGASLHISGNGNLSAPYFGLVAKIFDGNSQNPFITPLYDQHLEEWHYKYKRFSFDSWWNEIIFDNKKGQTLKRKDLVLTCANKDGGAHVDKQLPPDYSAMKSAPFSISINGQLAELDGNTAYASIAQIGWEVLNSIEQG